MPLPAKNAASLTDFSPNCTYLAQGISPISRALGVCGVNGLLQSLRNIGLVRLGAIGAALIGMAVFFVVLANRVTTAEMALLYSDLDLKDSGQIVQKLDAMNVPYELRAQGTQIMVPGD